MQRALYLFFALDGQTAQNYLLCKIRGCSASRLSVRMDNLKERLAKDQEDKEHAFKRVEHKFHVQKQEL
jgi:hypothetical protein